METHSDPLETFCEFRKKSSNKYLKILHQNADRMKNKIERFNHCLHELFPDVIVISEHGQNGDDMANTRLINYELVTSFCREVSAISIGLNRKTNLHILGIYRPLNNDKDAYLLTLMTLSSILERWRSQKNVVFIVGDFNVDGLKTSREGILLNELLAGFHMERIDLAPTRVTQKTFSSIDMCCVCRVHR
ncbi:hypothetical protein J6590_065259 [Homalodisca vitripennis]|nr:hypothetical protein J6590_065259 [Homalodisca vitripennis]